MGRIGNILAKWRENRKNHTMERAAQFAREVFQVCEYQNELWYTYNSLLFCPCDMMKDEPLKALARIRALYTERNGQTGNGNEHLMQEQ